MERLIGTEKQIQWAEKIRKEALEFASELLEDELEDLPVLERKNWIEEIEKTNKNIEKIKGVVARLETEKKAVWFIEKRNFIGNDIDKMELMIK